MAIAVTATTPERAADAAAHPAWIQPSTWVEFVATDADWDAAEPHLLTSMLSQLVLIRTFEEFVLELAGEGLIHGPAHSSIGQEGGAVGSVIAPHQPGHRQRLAPRPPPVPRQGAHARRTPRASTRPSRSPTTCARSLLRTLAEICGLDRGFSHGRGGCMHLQWKDAGAIGTNAIVGGGVPLAAGSAWAHRHAGTDAVAVTYFGDGATNIGSTLETFNLAAAWKLPLCFFIENNQYAVSTSVHEATGEPRLSARGPGFGIRELEGRRHGPARRPPGDAARRWRTCAPATARPSSRPTSTATSTRTAPFPGSAFRYRTKEEEAAWRAARPDRPGARAPRPPRHPRARPRSTHASRAAKALMADIGAVLLEPLPGGKPGQRRIKPAEWPDPAFVDVGVRGDLTRVRRRAVRRPRHLHGRARPRRSSSTPSPRVMGRRMATDDRIVVMGEDVHRLNGGTNGATRGLKDASPTGCSGTPISENAFTGLGGGIALDGRFRPVVEFMYADFMWVAADQLFNQIGKARHMFGGDGDVPFVLRSKVAMGTGYGSQHSMDPAGVFATARRLADRRAVDAVRLRRADEHRAALRGPGGGARARRPLRRRRARARSTTSTTASRSARRRSAATGTRRHRPHLPGDDVSYVLEAVEQVGDVDAEVIDLRWLDRASIDWDTIGASIQKTNHVLIAEQGALGHVVRRLAGRRDPAPLLRLARPPGAAGHRRRGVAEHQQGARARRDRPAPTRSPPAR